MHPSADAVPQLFSISADIRGCQEAQVADADNPRMQMRIRVFIFVKFNYSGATESLLSVHMIVVITFAGGAAVVKLICLPCHHIFCVAD